ncbi:MAG: proteasome accessory factor PafA2 family protein [Verrucomicrobiales bacterium]|nr:proteasome accessory factor PafA2 family protein [Verrucomicrobiales bacterium]
MSNRFLSSPNLSTGVCLRITGVETEYGCLVDAPLQVSEVVARIKDWVFEGQRFGLIDLHDRDWDEPASNGGFLFNGGRLYLDMGHLEYCTAECASALDVVKYDRAGDLLLNRAIEALGYGGQVTFIRNNIDHFTGATFGCHENYSLLRSAPLSQKNVLSLLSFLTLRALYAGSGRVGISNATRFRVEGGTSDEEGCFQISQRADYIQNDFFEWVQHNRAIINTRDEPLADPRLYRRLHLIHGDTNVLPSASFLKIGTTRLVFDLLEADDLPAVTLMDAVGCLRSLSRSPAGPWPVRLSDGRMADAIELLAEYHVRAARRFGGRDQETDAVLKLWAEVLEKLSGRRLELVGVLDWVTKEHILSTFRESENIDWSHPWLAAQDLEYHSTDPNRCLAFALPLRTGEWSLTDLDDYCLAPPANTRAGARSALMREIRGRSVPYVLDWDSVQIHDQDPFYLLDPFEAAAPSSVAGAPPLSV